MRMRNLAWLLLATSTMLAQPPSPSPPQNPAPSAVGSMSDLMVKMIYPTSDAIFYITTREPKSDAEWSEIIATNLDGARRVAQVAAQRTP